MAMLLCPKCGRMAFVRGDADPAKPVYCQHCGNKIERRVAEEKGMPDLLIDPEAKSLADAEGAFEPPRAAPVARASDMPAEKKLSPELPTAQARPIEDEPWERTPTATNPAVSGTAAGNRLTKVRRRKRNPVAELVKIVVGGFVGLAIGYGILLWGFRVDPFNMAHYLPDAMVPESVKTP